MSNYEINAIESPMAFNVIGGKNQTTWSRYVSQKESKLTIVRLGKCVVAKTSLDDQRLYAVSRFLSQDAIGGSILKPISDFNLLTGVYNRTTRGAGMETLAGDIGFCYRALSWSFGNMVNEKFIESINKIDGGLFARVFDGEIYPNWAIDFQGPVKTHWGGGEPSPIRNESGVASIFYRLLSDNKGADDTDRPNKAKNW